MPRETITLEPQELALVIEHPEELGLDSSMSRAKRNRAIFLAGMEALLEHHSQALRADYYAALADDPEARAVAADDHAMAFEDGLI
jgi:hypothetical protein